MTEDANKAFMRRAFALARKGAGKTFPNPMVGAVLVKEGRVAGEGFHRRAGESHAEIEAIKNAGDDAARSELYLNLEPCSHFGRTPPCVDAIISSGITRVICAMEDPDPRVSGKGFKKLVSAGIDLKKDFLKTEAERLNEVYIINKTKRRPFVTIKSAMTLDGKIATRTGLSKWITSEKSRDFTHRLRGKSDGIMTGISTLLKDDPFLNVRTGKQPRQPYKIIVDSRGLTSPGANIFKANPEKVIIATASGVKVLERKGLFVLECPGRDGRVDLPLLFERLLELGISTVLVEAGGELNAAILNEKLADKLYCFYAPKIFGGGKSPTSFDGEGKEDPEEAVRVKNIALRRFGDDILVEGYIEYPSA